MPSPLFLRSVANTKRKITEIIDPYLHYKRNGGGYIDSEVANLNRDRTVGLWILQVHKRF